MKKTFSLLTAGAASLLLQGCAIVGSVRAPAGGEGIGYMLPHALLPVELIAVGNALELSVGKPVVVGDTAHTYVLQRSSNVFTSDNVTVNVDPSTGLLTAIDLKSEDKTIPALIKLASARTAEAADAGGQKLVYRGMFDPGWTNEQVENFNLRMSATAVAHAQRLKIDGGCGPSSTTEVCKNILELDRLVATAGFKISVEGTNGKAREVADCSAGFCYRMNIPHVVSISGPGSSNSALFGLPNRSPTFVMPLERWAFVKTTHDVKLESGVFKSITTERPSSAFAIASAPLDLAKGVLGAVAEVVQLKIDLSGKEKALSDAKVKEIEAKAALDKALLDKSNGKAEAMILGANKATGTSLVIRVGSAALLDVNRDLKTGDSKAETVPTTNPVPSVARPAANSASSSSGSLGAAVNK
jgi:hypothetical protein